MDSDQIPDENATPRTTQPLRFHGSGSEYFGIWIVNLALTILTAGIFYAWAQVRSRRYFYTSTTLDGQSFNYTARGFPVFIGYLIIFTGAMIYNALAVAESFFIFPVILIFFVLWPWMYYKAIRFRFHNSTYRGIRFRFEGTVGKSYVINLAWMLLVIVTGGLLYPFVEYRRKQYLINNLNFGNTPFHFKGELGPFFVYYLIAYACIIAIYIGLFVVIMVVMGISVAASSGEPKLDPDNLSPMLIVGMVVGYLLILLLGVATQQFLTVKVMNYCLNQTEMENGLIIKADLSFWELLKIRLSNIFLIMITLGLYTPWARVKRHQYVVDHIMIHYDQGSLEQVIAGSAIEQNAIGDAASDFFDFDIGL